MGVKLIFLILPIFTFLVLLSNKISKALFFFFIVLFSTGFIYFILKNPLLGAFIWFLYLGAILVFFVFLIPLLNIRETKKEKKGKIIIYIIILYIITFKIAVLGPKLFKDYPTKIDLNTISHSLIRDPLGFELISIILLLGIIGAFILIKEKKDV